MRRALSVLLAVTGLAVTACGPLAQDGPDLTARQLAGIHQVAQDAATRSGVACALGGLDTGGLPTAPLGALFLQLDRNGEITREQEQALLIEIARDLWNSDLADTTLSFSFKGGGPTLGGALGTPDSFVSSTELKVAFGPQPPVSTPRPAFTDPGNPDC